MTDTTARSKPSENFAELIGRYGDKAYHFAFRLTGNEPDARDLVQEAFMKAYEHLDQFDPWKPFDAWLNTILHHIFIDGTRKLSHRKTVSLDAPLNAEEGSVGLADILPSTDAGAAEDLSSRERDAAVRKALARLAPEMRSVVVLCDLEGLSYEEAAKVMKCPLGTVRSRLSRAREQLREILRSYLERGDAIHGRA